MDINTPIESVNPLTMKQSETTIQTEKSNIERLLRKQQDAFLQNPAPSLQERIAVIKRFEKVLLNNQQALVQAINNDFGGRSQHESLIAEFMPIIEGVKYTRKHLKKWLRPSKRHVSLPLQPASAKVIYQPLGVVGIVVPWNYPVMLAASPLISALAAGNRVMIKMSEYTPETSALFASIISQHFNEDQIAVINGGPDVAAMFSQQPFDHLLFTGSTEVGRHVMSAAAKNLTPVTLELGGKSPTIVDSDFPVTEAAQRICFGKSVNAGQTCIAPDYVLVQESQQDAFVEAYTQAFKKMYPTLNHSEDYSAIINDKQFERLTSLYQDAKNKGATIRPVTDEVISDGSRRMPPCLILDPTEDMRLMQEEIFGPLLPIITVKGLDEALHYVQSRPRPLALYYFGLNKERQATVINRTHSGGVTINDTLTHVAVDDLPFGGIGPSGMGHYHGHEGFLTLSKAKPVLIKGKLNSTKFIYPPHNSLLKKRIIRFLTGKS